MTKIWQKWSNYEKDYKNKSIFHNVNENKKVITIMVSPK